MGVIRDAIKEFDQSKAVADEQKAFLATLDTLVSSKLQQMKDESGSQ